MPELPGECWGHAAAEGGSALERGYRCGWVRGVIALLLVSPGSRSPGAAEHRAAGTRHRVFSRLWEAGEDVPDPTRGAQASSLSGFSGYLQSWTRSANVLKGRGQKSCNYSCKLPSWEGKVKPPGLPAQPPCQCGASDWAAPTRLHCLALGTSWLISNSWIVSWQLQKVGAAAF